MRPSLSDAPVQHAHGLVIREYQAGDEVAILETFNRVFREVDPGFVPRSLGYWRWQYLANPGGWRIWLALTEEGRVVSQYSGVGQRMVLEGEPAHFSQAVDSMSDPAYRRGLKKPGVFVLTGEPYAANYGGRLDTIMWGLPVPNAWRIGKKYLGYDLIRTQSRLAADSRTWEGAAAPGIDVAETRALPDDLDDLFARASKPYLAIAVRDRAHYQWRFFDHPEQRYELAVARRGGQLVGLCFFRIGEFGGERAGLVCDWLTDPAEPGAAAALGAWLRERTLAAGVERTVALLPDTAADWLPLQRLGMRVEPTQYFLVGRPYKKGYDMRWLYHHWYYTLGDTDLV